MPGPYTDSSQENRRRCLFMPLDGGGRNGLQISVRVLGQDDIHGMGLIKGLHHLDAIAQ